MKRGSKKKGKMTTWLLPHNDEPETTHCKMHAHRDTWQRRGRIKTNQRFVVVVGILWRWLFRDSFFLFCCEKTYVQGEITLTARHVKLLIVEVKLLQPSECSETAVGDSTACIWKKFMWISLNVSLREAWVIIWTKMRIYSIGRTVAFTESGGKLLA